MKLLDLHIHGFGKFHDCTVAFQDGVNVVYGSNEAGKSTFHTFIRGMLFGIERQRGRAARSDLYSKYEPWENSGTYEGTLRVLHQDTVYRIERTFQKNNKTLVIVNETLGKQVSATKAFMDELLCGLNETTYNNTISIGQLKSATEEGMVSELRNYIANMNTSGNMALNITKASAYLKSQRRHMEAQLVPDAARSYTTVIGDIKSLEKEISSPEYENQISAYQKRRSYAQAQLELRQKEKEQLLASTARGKEILTQNQFTSLNSITDYQKQIQEEYEEYDDLKDYCKKKSPLVLRIVALVLATAFLGVAGYLFFFDTSGLINRYLTIQPWIVCAGIAGVSLLFYLLALISFISGRRDKKDLASCTKELEEAFGRHNGNPEISDKAIKEFNQKMAGYQSLSTNMDKSESALHKLSEEIASLQREQNECSEIIEKQQKSQWELEKLLETLGNYKTQAEGLKHTLAENEKIMQEIEAIDLAQETMTELSSTIKDSFGLYLNKTASRLISGITDGAYTSMSVDENLNVFLNTRKKLVPLEQVSSGTMDQVYLALRLAAAMMIQTGTEQMPLIFDDSFALYDDERLRNALKWLVQSYGGQIIIFTCHHREAQMLTANQLPYHLINISQQS
ncbi:MAG: AAA family ATPase [Hungatella hathewayi]|nr:AAA family ATPase [Hungatella hathewayi]